MERQKLTHREARLDDDDDFDNNQGRQQAENIAHEAQEEINRVSSHYENEIIMAKQERVEMVSKI